MQKTSLTNVITRVAFIAAGVLCVFRAPYITKWFPYLIGALMIITGVFMFRDAYPAIRRSSADRELYSSRMTRSLLLVMLGAATLFKNESGMPFLGVVWGLLGLLKGGRGLTAVLCSSLKEKKTVLLLIKAVIGIGLSFVLLFNPVDALGKHIILLGLQIIFYGLFRMDPEKRPSETMGEIHGHVDDLIQTGKR